MKKTVKPPVDAKFIPTDKARMIPQEQRRRFPREAFEDRNTKVKITMYLDLDILNHFKQRAAETQVPYQTQINTELRRIMEAERVDDAASVTRKLKEARTLIDTAIRAVQR